MTLLIGTIVVLALAVGVVVTFLSALNRSVTPKNSGSAPPPSR